MGGSIHPMKSVSLLFLSVLVTGLFLPGCASVPKATGVTVTIVSFRPIDESAVTTKAVMTLRFTSENVNALAFTGSSHQLYLSGRYVGRAENTAPIGMPAQGTITQDVIIELEKPEVVRQILSVADEGNYRLETVLYFTDEEHKIRIKSKSEGKIALHGLEAAAR